MQKTKYSDKNDRLSYVGLTYLFDELGPTYRAPSRVPGIRSQVKVPGPTYRSRFPGKGPGSRFPPMDPWSWISNERFWILSLTYGFRIPSPGSHFSGMSKKLFLRIS